MEGRKEPADRAQYLNESIVEAQKDRADALGVDAALLGTGDERVLVLELVREDLSHGRAERLVFVLLPDDQILAHAVDLDGFENQVNAGGPEEPADADQDDQFDASPKVEAIEAGKPEELLPEPEVPRLNGDECCEDLAEFPLGASAQSPIEGQVEELVQDEFRAERVIDGRGCDGHIGRHFSKSRRVPASLTRVQVKEWMFLGPCAWTLFFRIWHH